MDELDPGVSHKRGGDEALTAFSGGSRQAKVVELRYFGGLTEKEIVAAMSISPRLTSYD